LPRSRTAWLANFLTNGNAFCFHAGLLASESDIERLHSLIEMCESLIVGDSDPSLLPDKYSDYLLRTYPRARWVFVHRDPAEACVAYNAFLPQNAMPESTFVALAERIEQLALKTDSLTVSYESLKDAFVCEQIHEFCLGRSMDFPRWKQLDKMKITACPERWLAGMSDSYRARCEAVAPCR
jgi:hypothetical protein